MIPYNYTANLVHTHFIKKIYSDRSLVRNTKYHSWAVQCIIMLCTSEIQKLHLEPNNQLQFMSSLVHLNNT